MPYSAWLVFGVVLGAAVGFAAAGHDLEGASLGAVIGLFIALGMHSARRARSPAAMAALAVLGAVVVVGFEAGYLDRGPTDEAGFIWRDASVEPRPVRRLKGITLGESLREASARLGALEIDEAAPPAKGTITYIQRGSRIRLLVAGDRVTRVSYECAPDGDETRVNRIGCLASETRILEVFGQGARRLCAKVKPSAPEAAQAPNAFAFDVLDTGTRYVVLEGAVRGFIVMDPKDLDEALGGDLLWHRCN